MISVLLLRDRIMYPSPLPSNSTGLIYCGQLCHKQRHDLARTLVFPPFAMREISLGGCWSREKEGTYGTDWMEPTFRSPARHGQPVQIS